MWINLYSIIAIFLICCQVIKIQSKVKSREKRYLLFTPGTQFGVFATVSMPLHPDTTVSVAWFLEANYYNVANASYFVPLLGDISIPVSRKQRSTDTQEAIMTRKSVYIFIEAMLDKYGMPGHACLLRAICDNAEKHLLHNGVLGDLIYVLLTPSTSIAEDDIEDSYYEAEYHGLEEECHYYFDDCPNSPLDLISMSVDLFL